MNRQIQERRKFKVIDKLTGEELLRIAYLTQSGRVILPGDDGKETIAKELEPLFFTGFVDCAGAEVYDFDICKYFMDGVWKYGVIQKRGGGFGIHVTKMGDKSTPLNERYFGFQHFIPIPRVGNTMTDQFQKIGNAWADPELLFEINAQDTILFIAEKRAGRKLDAETAALFVRPTKIVPGQIREDDFTGVCNE